MFLFGPETGREQQGPEQQPCRAGESRRGELGEIKVLRLTGVGIIAVGAKRVSRGHWLSALLLHDLLIYSLLPLQAQTQGLVGWETEVPGKNLRV